MKRKLDESNAPIPVPKNDMRQDPGSFSSLGLDSRLLQAIVKNGFTKPTSVQARAIPLALERRDILGRYI